MSKMAETVNWKDLQPLEFQFMSRDTPQHNNLAGLAFPHLAERARAMMGAAHVPQEIQGKVAVGAICCATQLDGLQVMKVGDVTAT